MSSSSIAPVLTDEEEESLKRLEMRLTAQLAKVRKSLADEPNQQMKEGQMENESRMEIEPKKAEKKEEKKVEEVPENAAKNKRIRSELDLPMEVEDGKKAKFANSKWSEKLQNLEDFERIAEEAKKALTLLLNEEMIGESPGSQIRVGQTNTTTAGADRTVGEDEATVNHMAKCGANGTVERTEEDVDKDRQLRQGH
uniref:RPAP1_N domain-containing protein n=1 Tax=Globodera pallida TaxID=36090 RepID=A0A183CMY0_GLOPA